MRYAKLACCAALGLAVTVVLMQSVPAQVGGGADDGQAGGGQAGGFRAGGGDDEAAGEPVDDALVLKVYPVVDLVLPTPNYAFEGTRLPGKAGGGQPMGGGGLGGGGMGGGGGGGFGGGGAGGGAGFFDVPIQVAQAGDAGMSGLGGDGGGMMMGAGMGMPSMGMGGMGGSGMMSGGAPANGSLRFQVSDLIQAITYLVEPESWTQVGGAGTVVSLGGMLLVNQTPRVHEKVQDLLHMLRSEGGTLRTVTIRAHWLYLTADKLAELAPAPEETPLVSRRLDRDVLKDLAVANAGYQGEITCFDGQTVHIISGRLHTLVQGTVPVVGGEGQAGYQPVSSHVHAGALLQVTPSLPPGSNSVVLDLHSYVTRWEEPGKPIEFPQAHPLDRLNVVAHQLLTTLRVPLDQPVIAGGLTLDADSPGPDAQVQLYLVVEASVHEDEAEKPRERPN